MNTNANVLDELLLTNKSDDMFKGHLSVWMITLAALSPVLKNQENNRNGVDGSKSTSPKVPYLLYNLWSVNAFCSPHSTPSKISEDNFTQDSSARSALLMNRLADDEYDDEEWEPVLSRIHSHPQEIAQFEGAGGMNAMHAACMRYPPAHIIRSMLECDALVREEGDTPAALQQNDKGETPLHVACYSSSEEVQEVLLTAFPKAAYVADSSGDLPLHVAARAGATVRIMEHFLSVCPDAILKPNARGVTPFWLLPRSYMNADGLEEIFDDEYEPYCDDWKLLVTFLRFSYFSNDARATMEHAQDYASWMVHAAAACVACPRDVLKFLCKLFPNQGLVYDVQGMTPLLHACTTTELVEPNEWNEIEDGFREQLKLSKHRSTSPPETIVEVLLRWEPRAITYPDAKSGRLPLASAIVSGMSWKSLKFLITLFPSLGCLDQPTGFSLLQLAAMHSPDLETIYTLATGAPDLLVPAYRTEDNLAPKRSLNIDVKNELPAKRSRLVKDQLFHHTE